MKIKRLKNYDRLLDSYHRHFGLPLDPLEIFVDSTFGRQALTSKLNIQNQFKSSLNVSFKLVTSKCVLEECEALGSLFSGVLSILRQFKVLQCRHTFDPNKSATWCIKRRIRSVKSKRVSLSGRVMLFGLASNDDDLQLLARTVPGMPIFYVAHCRFNLEPAPLPVTELMEKNKVAVTELSENDTSIINSLKKRFGLSDLTAIKPQKQRSKQPNPLSCKKKSRKCSRTEPRIQKQRRRKRKRIKNTWAFQQALAKVKSELQLT